MSKYQKNVSMFDIDGRPPILKCLPLSMQHILAMIVGTVTVPIVVGGAVGVSPTQITLLVQYALIIAGISTLIQLYPIGNIGSRLPIIFGVGFTYVPTLVAVGGNYGLASILGAQLIGSGYSINRDIHKKDKKIFSEYSCRNSGFYNWIIFVSYSNKLYGRWCK